MSEQDLTDYINALKTQLKCPCGLNYEQSKKEPCLCPWAIIEDLEGEIKDMANGYEALRKQLEGL